MGKQQIGAVGLAVMGKNLALNMESKGFSVALYNRSREKTDELLAEAAGKISQVPTALKSSFSLWSCRVKS